jgi:IS5 family transposase
VLRQRAPHAHDFTNQRYRYEDRIDEVERAKNRTKSKVRSKVEHVFAGMKLKFGIVKMALSRAGQACEPPVCDLRTAKSVAGAKAIVPQEAAGRPHG